ncbi:hypothetical protein [Microbacterium sp.]|uniref:hypothetical protein n=1 Tax=Microbacterium sp. TaxID=51671 RepID=UPI0028AADDCD|nr:hypothetical protein [Microbacterium sp.]
MADNSAFAALIHDGLFDPSPKESILRVKDAVAKELTALDSTARIKSTDYFNHTFAPDFVMSWPDERSRRVYLRMAYDLDALVDDVALIDSTDPLIFGLTESESIEAKPRVDEVIADSDAMFTEPAALEKLIDRKKADSTANMLSNALAQGGKGSFVGNEAVELADVVQRGFQSAANVETMGTAEAIGAISARFQGQQAWRMNRVLQAVWEGSEGPLSTFPGTADVSGRLNIESLSYLLKYMRTDDKGFWRRVGRRLTLADLESLNFSEPNIQNLIQANLDVISARATIVKPDPLGVDEVPLGGRYRWSKRGRHVTFEAPNLFAVIGSAKTALSDVDEEAAAAVPVEAFMGRVGETDLVEVTLHSGPEHISVKSDEGAINKERLRGVSATFGGSAEVAQALVSSRTGRVTVDLPERSGTGKTQSKVRMADLLMTTIPLVVDVPDDVRKGIEEHLKYEDDNGERPLDLLALEAGEARGEVRALSGGSPLPVPPPFLALEAFTEGVFETDWDSPASE